MAATKRQMNWRSVIFTPVSGGTTTITGVTQIQIPLNGSTVEFSGDGDRFITTLINDFSKPMMTVTSADFAALSGIGLGTYGTLAAIHKDARQQTSSSGAGDMTVQISGMISDLSLGGSHRQIGQGSISITGQSSDGVTPPISVSFA